MFEICAKAISNDTGEIMIYGDIEDTKWGEEDVTPKSFNDAIEQLGAGLKNLTLRINSYGGSVFAGQAIVTMIDNARAKGVKVTGVIEGIAASMGSVIPQAADKVVMAENSMMMIHKPLTIAIGNADDMLDTAEMLDKAEQTLVGLYMRRFKGTEDELRELMKGNVDGTWLTADDALSYGLCDEVTHPVEMAACAKGYKMNGIVVPTSALKGAEDKIQIFEKEGGEKEMLYNEKTDAKIKALLDEGKAVSVVADDAHEDGYVVSEVEQSVVDEAANFLTAEQAAEALGQAVSAEVILDVLATAKERELPMDVVLKALKDDSDPPAEADPAILGKAEKYDLMFGAAVEDALTSGRKAEGEDFDKEMWNGVLNGLPYEKVIAMGQKWENQFLDSVHAGQGRVSRNGKPTRTISHKPEDYKL